MSSRRNVLKPSIQACQPTDDFDAAKATKQDHPVIFLGGIPKQVTRSELLYYLESFGKLNYFSMPYFKHPDNHKGFAKVYYSRQEAAAEVLRLENHKVMGLPIAVLPWVGKKKFISKKEKPSSCKLFLKFKRSVSEAELMKYFTTFGSVEKLEIKMNYKTHEPRDFGFIQFYDPSCSTAVMELGPLHLVNGKEVFLSYSKSAAELGQEHSKKNSNSTTRKNEKKQTTSLNTSTIRRSPQMPKKDKIGIYQHNATSSQLPVSYSSQNSLVHLQTPLPLSGAYPEDVMYHLTKPNSHGWNHEKVYYNHLDQDNLVFRKKRAPRPVFERTASNNIQLFINKRAARPESVHMSPDHQFPYQ